ncbi:MAG TPA: DUF3576 domain-containing protein [Alphaproteobacteria bacterium]|nr:DUF3576 domain-containing protein [Alphaproteobacteria bacterium]
MPEGEDGACTILFFLLDRSAMRTPILTLLAAFALSACGSVTPGDRAQVPSGDQYDRRMQRLHGGQTIFGMDGLTFGGSQEQEQGGSGIGVNSFLWRASLDTLSFLPVTSADPFGGVILTDWYAAPESPNERFKLNVYILDRQLRADGIRVSVFRQVLDPAAGWVDAPVSPETATSLENTILTRARELRVASAPT